MAGSLVKAGMTLDLSSMRQLQANLERFGDDFERAAQQGVRARAEKVFGRSQELVPVQWGTLKGSGTVYSPTRWTVVIAYGGPAVPYARRQHENLGYSHKPGKQAQFLGQPFAEEASRWPQALWDEIGPLSKFRPR